MSKDLIYDPSFKCDQPIDVTHIKGNVSEEEKLLVLSVFNYFVCSHTFGASIHSNVSQGLDSVPSQSENTGLYGVYIGRRLRCVEMNVTGRGTRCPMGQTVFEITVERDMCNVFGTLHGACAAYLVDPCSVSSLVVLGAAVGVNGTGVSQSMNLIWHQPAILGTKLKITATSVYINGRIRTARCEIWNENEDKLFVSAVHSTINNSTARARQIRGRL